jgi:hypothetical protein
MHYGGDKIPFEELLNDLLYFFITGWSFVIAVEVMDFISRRAHRNEIYDLHKMNLSALIEKLDSDRLTGE